eukprot:TRINITY_DN7994_c0_g1_i1.p1 TRINITY_DN7994_c0_g1~~TRINITY_DN7994_c0_g1_i1.p1  ORF type:complete len:346 (+),score=58.91 TRINITY_DN7994_c0_g1_i1:61-1038(+)
MDELKFFARQNNYGHSILVLSLLERGRAKQQYYGLRLAAVQARTDAVEQGPQSVKPEARTKPSLPNVAMKPKPQALKPVPPPIKPKPQALKPVPPPIKPKPQVLKPGPPIIKPKPQALKPVLPPIKPKPQLAQPSQPPVIPKRLACQELTRCADQEIASAAEKPTSAEQGPVTSAAEQLTLRAEQGTAVSAAGEPVTCAEQDPVTSAAEELTLSADQQEPTTSAAEELVPCAEQGPLTSAAEVEPTASASAITPATSTMPSHEAEADQVQRLSRVQALAKAVRPVTWRLDGRVAASSYSDTFSMVPFYKRKQKAMSEAHLASSAA